MPYQRFVVKPVRSVVAGTGWAVLDTQRGDFARHPYLTDKFASNSRVLAERAAQYLEADPDGYMAPAPADAPLAFMV